MPQASYSLTHFHFIQNYLHASYKARIKCIQKSFFTYILFPRHCSCQILGDMIVPSSSQMGREKKGATGKEPKFIMPFTPCFDIWPQEKSRTILNILICNDIIHPVDSVQ